MGARDRRVQATDRAGHRVMEERYRGRMTGLQKGMDTREGLNARRAGPTQWMMLRTAVPQSHSHISCGGWREALKIHGLAMTGCEVCPRRQGS